MKYFSLLLLSVLLVSCKGDNKTKKTTQVTQTEKHHLPAMGLDVFNILKDNCTAVDYIFLKLPFSINQTDKASILTNLSFFSPDQADALPPNCEALGREFFQADGEIIYEADIFYCPPSYFAYIFYEGKEVKFANKMSDAGVKFYGNLISQISAKPTN